jgi:hypothetical protein
MGVTIHYRGRLADLQRVEDFEDRVIDLVLELGGNVRIWRSADEQDRTRIVRGLMVDLAPGQETTSLLLSPEGWLINLIEIEDAEKGCLGEPPWCFIKTQFGAVDGHIALVELLTALKREFFPDLEVSDEGGYWERRDVDELRQKMAFVGRAINTLADAFAADGLTREAAEDPLILATRIERLARQVHATISRPAEHAPVHFPDDETGTPADPGENEARWDEMFRSNRRKQERMTRTLEEQMARGADTDEAFEAAIEEVIAPLDWIGDDNSDVNVDNEFIARMEEGDDFEADDVWHSGLPDESFDEGGSDDDSFADMQRHPLQQQATGLLMKFYDLAKQNDERSPNFDLLMRSASEITGGLAQVLPLAPAYEIDETEVGLGLVQLKRALRGAAFVRGALFLLRADELVRDEDFRNSMDECDSISEQIVELLRTLRASQQ